MRSFSSGGAAPREDRQPDKAAGTIVKVSTLWVEDLTFSRASELCAVADRMPTVPALHCSLLSQPKRYETRLCIPSVLMHVRSHAVFV
jgi:hypothetical protein